MINIKANLYFNMAQGLTPTGYYFMLYCKNIIENEHQSSIYAYDEFLIYLKNKIREKQNNIKLTDEQLNIIIYSILNFIYENKGIIQECIQKQK